MKPSNPVTPERLKEIEERWKEELTYNDFVFMSPTDVPDLCAELREALEFNLKLYRAYEDGGALWKLEDEWKAYLLKHGYAEAPKKQGGDDEP